MKVLSRRAVGTQSRTKFPFKPGLSTLDEPCRAREV